MTGGALMILIEPADEASIDRVRLTHLGPYRAMSAYKGDEIKGERDWPWIVVGKHGDNCFGRLWPKEYAQRVASILGGE